MNLNRNITAKTYYFNNGTIWKFVLITCFLLVSGNNFTFLVHNIALSFWLINLPNIVIWLTLLFTYVSVYSYTYSDLFTCLLLLIFVLWKVKKY